MTFLNPLDALIPKIPFSLFCRFLGLGHLRGSGVSLGRILEGPSIEPFFWGGGLARGLYRTLRPPLQLKARPPKGNVDVVVADITNNAGSLTGPSVFTRDFARMHTSTNAQAPTRCVPWTALPLFTPCQPIASVALWGRGRRRAKGRAGPESDF